MEGLEVSEIWLSDLENEMTIGSEYYGPMYLEPMARLSKSAFNLAPLSQLCSLITDGDHGSADYADVGVRFVLSEAVAGGWVEPSKCRFITQRHAETLKRSTLKSGDVLVTKTGVYFGKSAVVEPWLIGANTIAHVGILRLRSDASVRPYLLSTFLNSAYGNAQLRRRGIKATRPEIKLLEFDAIGVPLMSDKFQLAVESVVLKALEANSDSARAMTEADITLLAATGLDGWDAPTPLSYIRSSSEAFDAERFDAEYFHPQKASALLTLRSISDITVGDLFSSVRQLWQPDDGSPSDCVRNYDLNDALAPFLDGKKPPVAREEIASTKKLVKAGDLVVSRLRSYLREIAIVEPSTDFPMVASTEYIVLRPRTQTVLPLEALLVYLRSPLPQIVLKWSQDGSNHPRFDEKEILRMPVPRKLIANPEPYVGAMQKLKASKQRAGELLAAATRAVEIAIEDSEAAALAYLDKVAPRPH